MQRMQGFKLFGLWLMTKNRFITPFFNSIKGL